jgi:hypothetical protein
MSSMNSGAYLLGVEFGAAAAFALAGFFLPSAVMK